jgi:hypothetical protein
VAFVLPTSVGSAVIEPDVGADEIRAALMKMRTG